MSALPQGWTIATVEQLAAGEQGAITDGPFGSALKRTHYAEKGARVVRLSNLGDGQFIDSDKAYVPLDYYATLKRHSVVPGDILIAALGDPLGRACLAPHGVGPAIVKADCFRLRPHHSLSNSLILYWLNAPQAREAFSKASHGLGRVRINLSGLRALKLPIPPKSEQQRIVAKLEGLLARSSRTRHTLDLVPNLIDRYKQAILAKAFSGELTADWRLSYPITTSASSVRQTVLSEREEHRKAESVRSNGANRSIPSRTAALPELPSSWAWMTFDECSWDLTVGHVGPMKSRYVSSGLPFLRSFNVRPNSINLADVAYIDVKFAAELKKSRLRAGTIVVVRTGTPGIAAVVPPELDGAYCSDLVICRPIKSLLPSYAAHYVNSTFAQALVREVQVGVAQQHFNVGAMSRLALPFAPPLEQSEIVRRVETAFHLVDKLVAKYARADHLLPKLNQAILAKAFRGELVPQDPNDEPASELLKRISAQPISPGRRSRSASSACKTGTEE